MNTELTGGVSSAELCRTLVTAFENVLEFYENGTVKCIKSSDSINFLPKNSMRVLTEDFLAYMSECFVFEDPGITDCFAGNTLDNGGFRCFDFSVDTGGQSDNFSGIFFSLPQSRLFGFSRTESKQICGAFPGSERLRLVKANKPAVSVKTFGNFEIYKDGNPVLLHGEKVRELLALLVDRRGGFVSSRDGANLLWPGVEENAARTRFRKIAMRLSAVLEENGIKNIIEIRSGKRRIVPENIDCDLYEFLDDSSKDKSNFPDTYLKNYAWSSDTREYYSEIRA